MMRRVVAAIVAGGVSLAAGPARPDERVVSGDGIVAATVDGAPARLRIEAGAAGLPLLEPALALQAGLKPGFFTGVVGVGPVRIRVATAVAKLTVDGAAIKRRVGWAAGVGQGVGPAVDGTIGPAGLPEPRVRFVLRPAAAGERVTAMPLLPAGFLGGGWLVLLSRAPLTDGTILVRFDPRQPRSFVSAGAGALIAQAYGGTMDGATGTATIAMGVRRPVRRMRLTRPFAVGPFALDSLLVRTGDFGNAGGIPEAGAEPDPDETVTVTAKGKRDRGNDRLTLGADVLDRCSSILFDKAKREVRLSCR